MKKIIAFVLTLLLALSFAACRKQQPPQASPAPTMEPADAPTDVPATEMPADAPAGTDEGGEEEDSLSTLLEDVYAKTDSLELSLAPTMAVDLTDANALKTYLGLDQATGIAEAVVSEPLMSSVAYSVCLVRAAEGADAAALMRAIVDSVDPRKWICVEAESVSAVSSGDLILFVMTEQALSDELHAAFRAVVGETAVSAPVVRGK